MVAVSDPRLCEARTRRGNPCRNRAQPGSDYCRVHERAVTDSPADSTAHGLYSRFMTPEDLLALAVTSTELTLEDEIAFTRVVIARLAELVEEADSIEQSVRLAHALFRGTGSVAHLLRAQLALSGQSSDRISEAIDAALDELGAEWGLDL